MAGSCHIRGFGACMIGGFPHRQEDSFFHHAVERLRQETGQDIVDSLFTMGGFPVTRVPRHFHARCLAAEPDIVVLQFGSSDLVVPVRHRPQASSSISVQRHVSARRATALDRLNWQVRSLIGDGLRLTPVTPPDKYLETMLLLTQTLVEHQVIPVVLSPFVFGSRRSDRLARDCGVRLQQSLAALPFAFYVDAYAALDGKPRERMLLRDGAHLSLAGQQVVAETLYPTLKNLVDSRGGSRKALHRRLETGLAAVRLPCSPT